MGARPWLRLRRLVLDRDGHACQRCGLRFRPLEIHHVDGHRGHNDLSNLVAWCERCHIDYHKGEVVAGADEWREYVDELARTAVR